MTKKLNREKKLVRIESYGCTANQGASEIMAGLLKNAGFEVEWGSGEADLFLLNTCIVKSATHSKMIRRIRKIRETAPSFPLIVAGCLSQVYSDEILKIVPNVSLLGPHDLNSVVTIAKSSLSGHLAGGIVDRGKKEIRLNLPRLRKNSLSAIVQIARGCQSACSYCIVKKVMGSIHSYPSEQIKKEITNAIRDGCREILLTAQDLGTYGVDVGTSLTTLLRSLLADLPSEIRIRLGMLNAGNLRDELDDLLRIVSHQSIYSMLHLPIQSGDDGVLQRMNRSYSTSEFKDIITRIREIDPRVTLHTDVIVGFPGESEEGFKNTVDLIEWMQPDVMNLSKFSVRPGTAAAAMKALPSHIVKERSKILATLRSSISFELNKRLIGEIFNVLILKEYGNGKWLGRTESYKPVVFEDSSSSLGDFTTVHIVGATRTHLVGYRCS